MKEQNKVIHVGHTIKRKRKELFLTQLQLADMLGISYQLLQNYEYGKCNPPYELIPLLCKTLGIKCSELFGIEEDEFEDQNLKEIKNITRCISKNKELAEIIFNYSVLRKKMNGISISGILMQLASLNKPKRDFVLQIIKDKN